MQSWLVYSQESHCAASPLSDSCFQADASPVFLCVEKREEHSRFKFGMWQNHASLPGGTQANCYLGHQDADPIGVWVGVLEP